MAFIAGCRSRCAGKRRAWRNGDIALTTTYPASINSKGRRADSRKLGADSKPAEGNKPAAPRMPAGVGRSRPEAARNRLEVALHRLLEAAHSLERRHRGMRVPHQVPAL